MDTARDTNADISTVHVSDDNKETDGREFEEFINNVEQDCRECGCWRRERS